MSIQQEYNKQLKQSLEQMRRQQPNHIPVYAMIFRQASKQLVPDLKSPFGLYQKNKKLQELVQIITKQSKQHCCTKYQTQFKKQVYLYTIKLMPQNQQDLDQTTKLIKQNNKDAKGYFIKLQPDMTFADAFEKHGRQNVLTIVYTDKNNVKMAQESNKQPNSIKWLVRVLVFVIILILVPMIFSSSSTQISSNKINNIQQTQNNVKTSRPEMDIEPLSIDEQFIPSPSQFIPSPSQWSIDQQNGQNIIQKDKGQQQSQSYEQKVFS